MGIGDFALRRLVPAAGASAVAAWAGVTTMNDDWDDYFHSSSSKSSSDPNKQATEPERIVILGSGWAALSALRKVSSPDKSVVVVSPRPHFLYTPLLASSSVGTIALRSACEPFRNLIESAAEKCASATYVRADAREIDVKGKKVLATCDCHGNQLELSYDKLVIAVGSQPNTVGIPGVEENAFFLKEAEDSAKLSARLLGNLERAAALSLEGDKYEAEIDRLLKLVVVGGGPTGVELTAEIADFTSTDVVRRYGTSIADRCKVILVSRPRILKGFDEDLANVAQDHLISKGVDVRTGMAVTYLDKKDATIAPRTPRNATPEQMAAVDAATVTEEVGVLIWAAGNGPRPLVKNLAKSLGQDGRRGLVVDEMLRVVGADGVYAIGDAAVSGYAPTAQVAAQQGKHVGRALRDGEDSKFEYDHAGSLCCLGSDSGIAQLLPGGDQSSSSLNTFVWDAVGAPSVGKEGERALSGLPAFVLWRSLYMTRLLSNSSRMSLAGDWLKSMVEGRDVFDEHVLKRVDTGKGRLVESFGTELKRNTTVRFVNKPQKMNVMATDVDVGEKRKKRFWLF